MGTLLCHIQPPLDLSWSNSGQMAKQKNMIDHVKVKNFTRKCIDIRYINNTFTRWRIVIILQGIHVYISYEVLECTYTYAKSKKHHLNLFNPYNLIDKIE